MGPDPRERVATFVVGSAKLSRYLLDASHPRGAAKAAFFFAHGFSAHRPDDLSHALRRHGREGIFAAMRQDAFGALFEIDGGVLTPRQRVMHIRTVWALREVDALRAEFVTAFPRRP